MTTADPRATHLLFVRHGQSLFNRDGDSAGDNSGLTELGWRQAHLVADWLARHYRANVLLTSTLIRSRQTADVIGLRLGLPVRLLPGIEEADKPYWDELPASADNPLAPWDLPWQPEPAVAPVYAAFRERIRGAFARIMAAYAGQTIIIVAHGGSIGTILRSLFGGHYVAVFTENGAISHLLWQEGHWRLIEHNVKTHLANLGAGADEVPSLPWSGDASLRTILSHFGRVAGAPAREPTMPAERDLRALIALATPGPQDRLLDVGTGCGNVAFAFAPYVREVVGVDVSPEMLEAAERARLTRRVENVYFRWADANRLPFEPGSFDIIICHDLLPYIFNPRTLLADCRRILAPAGRLILDEMTGNDNPVKRATHDAIEARRDPAFLKSRSMSDIGQMVDEAGFHIAKAESYEVQRESGEWLDRAAADDGTRAAVRAMLETSIEGNAAGLDVRRGRNGTLTFTQRRMRLLGVVRET